MEQNENNIPTGLPLSVSREIIQYLTETSKWGKFLAIIGYITMGIMVLLGALVMFGFSFLDRVPSTFPGMRFMGLFYILMGVFYYFPVTFLYRFSIRVRRGIEENNPDLFEEGFRSQKSLFKFLGIFTIVILGIYALILLIAIPVAML